MVREWVIDDDVTYLKVVVTVKNTGKVKTEIEQDGTLLDLLLAPKELQDMEQAWEPIDTKIIFEDCILTRGETITSPICLFKIPSRDNRIHKLRSCIISNGQDWETEKLVKYDCTNTLVKKVE